MGGTGYHYAKKISQTQLDKQNTYSFTCRNQNRL